jgi:hypothetical protein
MILDYNHVDVTKLSPSEKSLLNQGLCPYCSNDSFKLEAGIFANRLFVCAKCDKYCANAHVFKPKRIV